MIPAGTNRIIVLMPTWVGDVCMATPALVLLRSKNPEATITAALRPGLSRLLSEHPAVDAMIEIDPSGLLGPRRAGRVMAALDPQAVLVLPGSFRSALTARFSGAPQRIGYRRDGRSWLLTSPVDRIDGDGPVSAIDWYVHLAIGDSTEPGPMHLEVTDADCTEAAELLGDSADPFIVLVPGANRADKRWPADRFTALADRVHADLGWRVVLAGSPGERALTAAIADTTTAPVLDLARGGGTLGGLKAVIAAAELVVSNDTGPRHVSIAVGTPVVSLIGPTDHRWTVSMTRGERRLLAEPFLPEELTADASPDRCTMDRIAVDDVLHAVHDLHGG